MLFVGELKWKHCCSFEVNFFNLNKKGYIRASYGLLAFVITVVISLGVLFASSVGHSKPLELSYGYKGGNFDEKDWKPL